MPPVEWSMVQSVLLTLILPTCGTALALMSLVTCIAGSDRIRSVAASMAFLAGLTAGLGVQNSRGQLIPFFPIQQVEQSPDQFDGNDATKIAVRWEFETGWRCLYCATILTGLSAIAIESLFRQRSRSMLANIATCLVALTSALLTCPWDLTLSRPWMCGVLAVVIVFNETSLRRVSQLRFGSYLPMFLAIAWGGSAIAVTVLSHSARFADLAMLLGSSLAGVGLVTAIAGIRTSALYAGPACFIPALMLADHQNAYSDIPIASFALIAIAPTWLVLPVIAKANSWFESRPIGLALWFLIPCIVAVGLAIRAEF